MAQPTPDTRAARRRLRSLRQALSPEERVAAERVIAQSLARLRLLRPGARVAIYLAMRGEVDLAPVIDAARRAGCHLYVPRVMSRRRGRMAFVPFAVDATFRRNAYGIAEPVSAAGLRIAPQRLDVVLLPVVGFDRTGNRLGMGAGYYDRALRHLRDRARAWRRPRLVGLAYACQEVAEIESSPWDVPLDLVVTEREVVRPSRGAS